MNVNSDTGEQPTGLMDAATAFEGMLTAEDKGDNEHTEEEHEEGNEEQHSEEEGEEHPENEGEDEDADDKGEETSEEDEDKSDEDANEEGDADGENEEQENASGKQPQTVTVKVDGKEIEVPLEEAIKGYQRQADYSQKTAKLAEQRRAHEADVEQFATEKQSVTEERGQYAHLLRALQARLDELTPQEPDWVSLAQQVEPAEYQRAKATWDAIQEQKKAVKEESERVAGLQKQENQKQFQTKIAKGRNALLAYEPAWKDPKKWDADRNAIFSYGQAKLGFTPQEIANATDPRAIIAVHKAMLYDKLMENKPQPTTKKSGKGKSPKTLAAGSSNSKAATTTDVTKAKQRLAKTGRIGDAAALFEQLL